jgi:hypothetical protein
MRMKVQEKIKSGMKPKMAIAQSLAEDYMERKNGSVDSKGDMGDAGEAIYPEGSDDQGLSDNVEAAGKLGAALTAYSKNQNTNDFEPDDSVAGMKMSRGGQVQSEMGMPMGNKPDLGWIDDGTGEPMAEEMSSMGAHGADAHRPVGPGMTMGLGKDAMEAIMKKKKNRKYGQFDPK